MSVWRVAFVAPSHHVERLDEHNAPIQPTYQKFALKCMSWTMADGKQVARDDRIDVKGRTLPDDRKLNAKDAGEQAQPRTTSTATHGSNSCA